MQIKTFAQACKKLGLKASQVVPKVAMMPKQHRKSLIATAKLIIIAQALNDGWVPDWNNYDEYKYYPWFYMNKPAFRFDDSACAFVNSFSAGGSRLCYRTRELSDYAGKTFIGLYKDMMTIPK